MSTISDRFDPWGPVSSVFYEINDSDFVQDAIAKTGVDVSWRPLSTGEAYSHGTRIRALRRDIAAAYASLKQDQKGLFTQIIVKAMLRRHNGEEIRQKLADALGDIGWVISEDQILQTSDALVAEQFFPLNSEFDAYIAIQDVFSRARQELVVVDAYLGSSVLVTIRSLVPPPPVVRLLTVEHNLKPDFLLKATAFRTQIGGTSLEIKSAPDFHDRFIGIDSTEFYHVGASIKDAGKRAFMISRLEDQSNIEALRTSIDNAWAHATLVAI